MATIADAVLNHRELLQPFCGYTCYGLIENTSDNSEVSGLPICLAENVKLKRDISKDEKILINDLEYEQKRFGFQLYARALEQTVPG